MNIQGSSFNNLPEIVFDTIIMHLPIKDGVKLGESSKRINAVIKETIPRKIQQDITELKAEIEVLFKIDQHTVRDAISPVSSFYYIKIKNLKLSTKINELVKLFALKQKANKPIGLPLSDMLYMQTTINKLEMLKQLENTLEGLTDKYRHTIRNIVAAIGSQ